MAAFVDPNTFLIISNLALATAILYLIMLHHNETKHKKHGRKK